MRRLAPLLVLSSVLACAHSEAPPKTATPSAPAPAPAPAPAEVPAVPQTLAADTARTTQAGATYTAPGGWSVADKGALSVLTPPEGGLARGHRLGRGIRRTAPRSTPRGSFTARR